MSHNSLYVALGSSKVVQGANQARTATGCALSQEDMAAKQQNEDLLCYSTPLFCMESDKNASCCVDSEVCWQQIKDVGKKAEQGFGDFRTWPALAWPGASPVVLHPNSLIFKVIKA